MQTLNVSAGQTEEEYKALESQRRADLREEARADANYFFWAAGLAALGTGLLPIRVNVLVNIGIVDLLRLGYAHLPGPLHILAVYGVAVLWMMALGGLGVAARTGYRWAFLAGIVLYGADMIALISTFSLWAFGVHSFLVFKWFEGQKCLRDLSDVTIAQS